MMNNLIIHSPKIEITPAMKDYLSQELEVLSSWLLFPPTLWIKKEQQGLVLTLTYSTAFHQQAVKVATNNFYQGVPLLVKKAKVQIHGDKKRNRSKKKKRQRDYQKEQTRLLQAQEEWDETEEDENYFLFD